MNVAGSADTDPPVNVDLNSLQSAEAALRAFWHLAAAWRLTVAAQLTLLGVARSTLYRCKQGHRCIHWTPVSPSGCRISSALTPHCSACCLFPPARTSGSASPTLRPSWQDVRRWTACCDGQLGDLLVVRQYLAAQYGDAT